MHTLAGKKDISLLIDKALREDAYNNDITTNFLVDKKSVAHGYILAKEDAIVCGIDIVKILFKKLDKNFKFHPLYKDGDLVKKNKKVVTFKGNTRALLTGERTALNFLGLLSGISTKTNKFAQKIQLYKADILCTRKTTPGLRRIQKYAVRCGGGKNHRFNLKEMVFIKDNHREIYHTDDALTEIIRRFRKHVHKPIIVEVDTLAQFKQALKGKPDYILLDNMSTSQIIKAVNINKKIKMKNKPLLEASGGINMKNVKDVAKTGVDRISVGSLTHAIRSINFSMEIFNVDT